MAIGGVFAHLFAYRLVAPDPHAHHRMMEASGHGYFAHIEFCLAVCGAVVLLALLASVASRASGLVSIRAPLWIFALVPPAGFALQEHLERFLHTGAFPQTAAFEPTFVVGLLLQLPFALAAYLAVRALLALASAIVETLRAPPRPRLTSLHVPLPIAAPTRRPRASALALGYGQRAPPLAAV
jgi:hypothetical protein